MNTSQKISAVIGILQQHEHLHELLRAMLLHHTNEGFMITRDVLSPAEKWNTLEAARRDLLAALQLVAAREAITLPAHLQAEKEGVPHAGD